MVPPGWSQYIRPQRRERLCGATTLAIDWQQLERLGAIAPSEKVTSWIRQGIEEAEQYCQRLTTLPNSSQELTREAHTLKGTSGIIGLTRISQIAAEIEDGVRNHAGVEPLVMELRNAIAATRDELQWAGLLSN